MERTHIEGPWWLTQYNSGKMTLLHAHGYTLDDNPEDYSFYNTFFNREEKNHFSCASCRQVAPENVTSVALFANVSRHHPLESEDAKLSEITWTY